MSALRENGSQLLRDAADWLQQVTAMRGQAAPDEPAAPAWLEGGAGGLVQADGPRPLVVALFGGTGVGKSSLLNRLVGEQAARVGVERPTSHEATIYVHADVPLAPLRSHLPVDQTLQRRHSQSQFASVIWIDMPDIDSVETRNRAVALAWLPHIDVVIYVVSPERYRDDAGWRVLLRAGGRHGWLFVMNRSDEQAPGQREHFEAALRSAGFSAPRVLATCCRANATHAESGVDQVRDAVLRLAERQAGAEFERLGLRARFQDARAELAAVLKQLPSAETLDGLRDGIAKRWDSVRRLSIVDATATALAPATPAALGERLAQARKAGVLDAVSERICIAIDETEIEATRAGVALAGETERAGRLDGLRESASSMLSSGLEQELAEAVASPAGPWRRAAWRCTRWATRWLPLVALLVLGGVVVWRFVHASSGSSSYLDHRFATHAALLLAVAWGIPALAERALRPDWEVILARAGARGLRRGIARVESRLTEMLETEFSRHLALRAQGERIEARIRTAIQSAAPVDAELKDLVAASREGETSEWEGHSARHGRGAGNP